MYYFGVNFPIVEITWIMMIAAIAIIAWTLMKKEPVKTKKSKKTGKKKK